MHSAARRFPRLALATALLMLLGGGAADAQSSNWSTARLSQPRVGPAVATAGSVVLWAAGSWVPSLGATASGTVDVFDTATRQWTAGQLAEPRFDPTPVSVGQWLLFAGGSLSSGVDSSTVDVYDSTADAWNTLSLHRGWHQEPPDSCCTPQVVGNQVLFAFDDAIDVLDPASGTVASHPLPMPHATRAATTAGNQALFLGASPANFSHGADTGRYADTVDIYDASTRSWSLATLAQPRFDPVVAVSGATVVITSEFPKPNPTADLYDVARKQWQTTPLPIPAEGIVSVLGAGDAIAVVGDAGVALYRPSTASWTPIDGLHPKGHAELVTAGKLVIVDGHALDIVDPASGNHTSTPIPSERVAMRGWGTWRAIGSRVVYAAGEVDRGIGTDRVDVYDLVTNQWSVHQLQFRSLTVSDLALGGRLYFGVKGHAVGDDRGIDVLDGTTGDWSSYPLSESRTDLGSSGADTTLVIAGGKQGAGVSATVDVFDTASRSWTTSQLSQPRARLIAGTVGSRVLIAGGAATLDDPATTVDLYDTRSGELRTAALPQPRRFLTGTGLGTLALFAGGDAANLLPSDVVDIYDAAADTWTTEHLSQARTGLGATSVGNLALFAGGSRPTSTVDIYDSVTDQWSTAALSEARSAPGATSVGTLALFAGGQIETGFSDRVDIYDASTGSWSIAKLSTPRAGLAATHVGTRALFAGPGQTPLGHDESDTVDIFDSATGRWTVTHVPPRDRLAATSVGTQALFASADGMIDVYDDATGQWSTSQLSVARSAGIAAASVGGLAFFAGGSAARSASDVVDIYAPTGAP